MVDDSGALNTRFLDILLEMHRAQRSGIVRMERGPSKKQLAIDQGSLAFAESNLPEEHLAHVLMKLGLLPRKELKNVAALMRKGKSSGEAVILATGLDGSRLEQGLREQTISILASLFTWNGAEIRLFANQGLPDHRFNLAIPLPQAIVEAARRAARNRNAPDAFLHPKGNLCADSAAGLRGNIPLNSAEAYAYAQAAKPIPAGDLLALLPRGDAKPEELVQCLLLLGLLRIEAPTNDHSAGAAARLSDQIEELLLRFELANLYEILSVPPDAREQDIKAAYHELARQYHPDLFASKGFSPEFRARVEKLFTYFTGAYTTLSDPVARASYDETRLTQESQVEATLHARAAVDSEKEKIAETLFRAGRSSLLSKDFENAVKKLKECVWLRPETARYHHFLAVAQAEIPGLRKEAEMHLIKALELDSMSSDSHLELGKLYMKVNLPTRAEVHLNEALRWDPENREALRLVEEIGRERQAGGMKKAWI